MYKTKIIGIISCVCSVLVLFLVVVLGSRGEGVFCVFVHAVVLDVSFHERGGKFERYVFFPKFTYPSISSSCFGLKTDKISLSDITATDLKAVLRKLQLTGTACSTVSSIAGQANTPVGARNIHTFGLSMTGKCPQITFVYICEVNKI